MGLTVVRLPPFYPPLSNHACLPSWDCGGTRDDDAGKVVDAQHWGRWLEHVDD